MKTETYKVSLRGPSYPDIGGVTTHIDRLSSRLKDDGLLNRVYSSTPTGNHRINDREIIDTSWRWLRYNIFQTIAWYFIYGFRDKARIVHLHDHPVWDSPVLLLMLLTGKKVAYTIHDQLMLAGNSRLPAILLFVFKIVSRRKNIRWIVVNERIKDQIRHLVPCCNAITVIPAYLEQTACDAGPEPQLEEFIKMHTPLLFMYAHHVRRLDDKDLYGIDQAIEATANLKEKYGTIGLLISIPNENPENVAGYRHRVSESGIDKNVLFYLSPLTNVRSVLESSSVVLRPTLSDGDSMIIREALCSGTKVVASDAAIRPAGVLVFKKESIQDLVEKIQIALSNDESDSGETSFKEENYEKVRMVYNELFDGKCR